MTDERRTVVLSAEEKICEITGRVLRLQRRDVHYDLAYNGEIGWLSIDKWVLAEAEEVFCHAEHLVWRCSLPAGGDIFGVRYYSLDEILTWLEEETNGADQSN